MGRSKIEWTDQTWNCLRGCTKVSAGCRECYAERQAARFAGPGQPYAGLVQDGRWSGAVRLLPELLDAPRRWRRPRMVFVASMSDPFHALVPDDFLERMFAVMEETPQHTYQLLTKRPERMVTWLARSRLGQLPGHIWLGTSVEDQASADERVPVLLACNARMRFVSCEPLLGPVRLDRPRDDEVGASWSGLGGLFWVIVGGESGPRARPCEVGWIRGLVEQCRAAGVPAFVKQMGARSVARSPGDLAPGAAVRRGWGGGPPLVAPFAGKGNDPGAWAPEVRVREWPSAEAVR
jgi:protein gp37